MIARTTPVLLLLATASLPGIAQASEHGCIPQPPSDAIQDLLAATGTERARIPPDPDKVDRNSYDYARGDNDGDGTRNDRDAFPNDPRDTVDSDKDGHGDNTDAFPKDKTEWKDSDCDGVGDNADTEYNGLGRVSTVSRWSGDGVYGQNVKFTMLVTPDGITRVTLEVKLTGSRNDEREAAWEKEVEAFWSNKTFHLDLDFVESGYDNTVHISRGSGRANSGNWFTSTNKWVAAHEIGHLLGLNDEYADNSDRYRLLGESNSIMRYNWEGAKPYQRHIDTILSHFDCDRSRAATARDIPGEDDQVNLPEPDNRPKVHAPEGTTKYIASGDAFSDCFVKKDDEKVYMAHGRGDWWQWTGTQDGGQKLEFVHPTTGEEIVMDAAELSVVVPAGTVIETEDTGAADDTDSTVDTGATEDTATPEDTGSTVDTATPEDTGSTEDTTTPVEEPDPTDEDADTVESEDGVGTGRDDQPWLRDGLPPPPWWRRRNRPPPWPRGG